MNSDLPSPDLLIRHASADDLTQLTEIYNHYIINTHFTFDIQPFTVEARAKKWFGQFGSTGRYQLFVAAIDHQLLGYASSTPFKPKQAYETSVDFTIYLAPPTEPSKHSHLRRGVGRQLYQTLIDALAEEDVHRAYAGVAIPNEPSLHFHRSLGFTEVGTYREVGRKFNQYWDVIWLERPL